MSELHGRDVPLAGRVPLAAQEVSERLPRARLSDAAVVALVALAGAAAWLILFYPGLMSADSAGQLMEARKGIFSDGHPPLTAVVWALLDRVVAGPFGMFLLQTVLLWTGLALLADRLSAPAVMKAGFLLLVGFAPPVLSIAGAIWKDVLMAAFLLMAFGLAASGRTFWIFALLATMSRHNAVLAVIGAVLLHFSASGPSIPGLLRAVAGTAALLVLSLGIGSALVQHRGYPTQMVALFDVVGMAAVRGTTPDLPACFLRKTSVDTDDAARSYDPRSIAYLMSAGAPFRYCFEPDEVSVLVRGWLGAIAAHPVAYLTHRLKVFGHLLGLHDTPGNYIMTRSTYVPADHPGIEAPPSQSRLQVWLEGVVLSMKPYGIFRPWIYAVLAITASAVALGSGRWWPFCIALSGLAYEAGLLIVAPSEDYRYSLWMIMSALVAAAWVAIEMVAARSRVSIAS